MLEAAQNVAQQLQELQFVYIKENMKQGCASAPWDWVIRYKEPSCLEEDSPP